MDPHTEKQLVRPPHIDRKRLNDEVFNSSNCFLIQFCSQIPHPHTEAQKNGIDLQDNRQMPPHSKEKRKKDHTTTY